jgi:uncharacterized protein
MFNYVFEKDNHIFLYNTCTKTIAKSSKTALIKKILADPSVISEKAQEIIDQMVTDGFLVESRRDEVVLASLKHFDMVANNSLALTILPTLQCNFECKYCYLTNNDAVMNKESQDNLIQYLKKNINEYNSLEIEWFGGEPLIAIDVINNLSEPMIKICQERYKPYKAFITTNAYHLTLDVFKQMLKNRIIGYQITLDGPRELHNQLRILKNGNPTFDRILNNLRDIRDHIKSSGFTITLRTNVTRELMNEIDPYLEFLESEFGGDNRFSFLFIPVGDWGGERVKAIKDSLPDSRGSIYEKLISSKHQLNYRVFYKILIDQICVSARRNSYTIGPGGKVYKCSLMLDNKQNLVGSINEQGNMLLDEEKISKWIYRFDNLREECLKCCFRPLCNNSLCPANAIIKPAYDKCGFDGENIGRIMQLIANGALKSKENIIKYYE